MFHYSKSESTLLCFPWKKHKKKHASCFFFFFFWFRCPSFKQPWEFREGKQQKWAHARARAMQENDPRQHTHTLNTSCSIPAVNVSNNLNNAWLKSSVGMGKHQQSGIKWFNRAPMPSNSNSNFVISLQSDVWGQVQQCRPRLDHAAHVCTAAAGL